jgi:PD-(D/E)XK nuclease superfamily protein
MPNKLDPPVGKNPRAEPASTGSSSGNQACGSQLSTKRRGEVAEAAFLHKAASLGFSVAKPWGESDRYDFIVENGVHSWRVQVKSAHTSALNGYGFHACGNVHSQRYTPRDIDFLVGYVVPEDVWYVLPIQLFSAITTVKVFPTSKRRMSRYEKYREAWCLMACPNDGSCRKEINVRHCCQPPSDGGKARCPKVGS